MKEENDKRVWHGMSPSKGDAPKISGDSYAIAHARSVPKAATGNYRETGVLGAEDGHSPDGEHRTAAPRITADSYELAHAREVKNMQMSVAASTVPAHVRRRDPNHRRHPGPLAT